MWPGGVRGWDQGLRVEFILGQKKGQLFLENEKKKLGRERRSSCGREKREGDPSVLGVKGDRVWGS